MRHHELALDAFTERVRGRDDVEGVVLTGSVARGDERPDSDVDLYLVVTPERWADAVATRRVMYVEHEGADYPGGYLDVKLVASDALVAARHDADDAFRASLLDARVVLDRGGVAEAVAAATVVPRERWAGRTASFLAQVRLHAGYFLAGAERDGDPLLARSASTHALLAAHRALLAGSGRFSRGPKYLAAEVASLASLPDDWERIVADLLARPTAAAGRRLIDSLDAHVEAPLDDDTALSLFVLDNEYAWRTRIPAPEYS